MFCEIKQTLEEGAVISDFFFLKCCMFLCASLVRMVGRRIPSNRVVYRIAAILVEFVSPTRLAIAINCWF